MYASLANTLADVDAVEEPDGVGVGLAEPDVESDVEAADGGFLMLCKAV